jgi:hypothetical protein
MHLSIHQELCTDRIRLAVAVMREKSGFVLSGVTGAEISAVGCMASWTSPRQLSIAYATKIFSGVPNWRWWKWHQNETGMLAMPSLLVAGELPSAATPALQASFLIIENVETIYKIETGI